MRNFSIDFTTSPWLLFLLIPAIALALWPYLRLSKRFRRSRNRVCSLILHIIILILCVCLLAGMQFSYDANDSKNEMILLVDLSFSSEEDDTVKEERNEFIQDILDANHKQCKIGIVTFGYTQKYVAEMSYDVGEVYAQYEQATPPDDTSATDIASALQYASSLFKNPDHGKIVLISDGLQTDGDALTTISDIATKNIRVDSVCFSPRQKYDVQVTGITLPDRDIEVEEEFNVEFSLQTSVTGIASYSLVDEYVNKNGETVQNTVPEKQVEMNMGIQNIKFSHKFMNSGLHKLYLRMESNEDSISFNNQYYAYYELYVHERVLIIERYAGEAESLDKMLDKDPEDLNDPDSQYEALENEFLVDTACIDQLEGSEKDGIIAMPRTLNQLREYDQVILVNIAHEDFGAIDEHRKENPIEGEDITSFESDLYAYVREWGGGMLTVGGYEQTEDGEIHMETDKKPYAHSYVRTDMKGTRYQDLLPVNIDSYTPPVAVAIMIDGSRTMTTPTASGATRFELAKRAALSCLDAMSSRDYCSVGVFNNYYSGSIGLTPAAQKSKLENAIRGLNPMGQDKILSTPIYNVARMLNSGTNIENKHIVMITDETIPSITVEDSSAYYQVIQRIYDDYNITLTIAGIDLPERNEFRPGDVNPYTIYQEMADLTRSRFFASSDIAEMADYMVDDLRQTTLVGITPESFTPVIQSRTAAVSGVDEGRLEKILMGGFFVSKAKTTGNVQVALLAKGVPLYAQWDFGKGRVGSFMCDLGSYFWGSGFIENSEGIKIVNNIVHDLMPAEDIRAKEVDAVIVEDNYTTKVSVYTELKENQILEWRVVKTPWTGAENVDPDAEPEVLEGVITSGSVQRFSFNNFGTGIYSIVIVKKDSNGVELARHETYRNFSYSKEYNVFRDTEEGRTLMSNLAANANGKLIESIPEIYQNIFALNEVFDPRILFIILAIILFLLDVAVRKFKFKWPHEIIRDLREKKEQEKS